MSAKKDLIGEIFGRLTVISQAPSKNNRTYWNCACSCTNPPKLCVVNAHSLRSGGTKSCGCIRKETSQAWIKTLCQMNTLPDGEASFNLLYATYRNLAENRGLEFALTKPEFKQLTSGNCHYCGVIPKQVYHGATCKTFYTYNGVDRQNNEKGYILSNSVSCCGTCNDMKRTRTVDAFLNACFGRNKP